MSHDQQHEQHPHQEEEDEDQGIDQEDVIEVYEDDGDEPMDEDDDNAQYDGEIVIGAPMPGEEQEEYEAMMEDNSLGATSLHAEQKSIFTISFHPSFPNPPLAVTGGEDDMAYLYSPIPSSSQHPFNADSFKPVKLTGHTDSVIAADFNFDGEMVASGGMDGRVRVWRRVKSKKDTGNEMGQWQDWEFLTSLETSSEITWLAWHPKGNVLAAGCEDATVWLWNLPSGQNMTVLSSHTMTTTSGLWPSHGKTLLTASLDSSLISWDPRSPTPIFKISIFCAPNNPEIDPSIHGITSIAIAPNGQIAAVGGSNGLVKIVNLTKGDIVATLKGHSEGESIEALVFVDLLAGAGGGKGVVLVSGATDGKGFVWDVATGRVRAELQHSEPITSLAAHPSPTLHLVTSASADSTLKTWDVRTGALIAEHKGHSGVINGVAVGPSPDSQGQIIASAGDEGVSLLWKV